MHHGLRTGMTAAALGMLVVPLAAQAQPVQRFDIAEADLAAALRAFAAATGREILAPSDLLSGRQATAVRGDYSAEAALAVLLRRSGLRADIVDGAFVIRPIAGVGADPATDIVVTGTRIRGAAPIGATVVTIDRAAIDASGRGSVAEILETIPQNFGGGPNEATATLSLRSGANLNSSAGAGVNLRGLGTTATLVLLDGARPPLGGSSGAFSDISLIPSTAIERIEVLTDGASALYGTDAIAGVVNFRFRNRFEGFETRLRTATADGDFGDVRVSQIAGVRWTDGGVALALEYQDRGRLSGSDRAYATEDLRPYGGPDLRSVFANPGTIVAANNAIFAIPQGQDGTRLTPAQLIPGVQNRSDQQKLYDLLGAQERLSAFLSVDQQLGGGIGLFARALLAGRDSNRRGRLFGPRLITVPVSNAFYIDPIGTRQPVRVRYDLARDLGVEEADARVRSAAMIAGVEGRAGSWSYEIAASYGVQSEEVDYRNFVNTARLAAALADPDRRTAFNVFGDGSNTNAATIAAVRGSAQSRTRASSWSAGFRADGALLDLPAGSLKLAFGADHREERFDNFTLTDRGAAITRTQLAGNPGVRRVDAVYGELLVPVIDGRAFPGTLSVSLAGRIERYSDVGLTSNPKIGVRWAPTGGIALRAAYGTSFRAPLFEERGGPLQNLYIPILVPDPQAASGQTAALLLRGFAPTIGPERASTLTLGVDLTPAALPGLRLSASYFRIDYRDRIGDVSLDTFNLLVRRDLYAPLIVEAPAAALVARYYADPQFQNPSNIPAASIGAILDAQTMNLGRTTLDGFDVELRYTRKLARATLTLGADATHFLAIRQRVTASAPSDDILGTVGTPVAFRGRGTIGWSHDGGASLAASVNYTGRYRNQLVTPAARVAAATTVDAQIAHRIGLGDRRTLRLALSATNVFDADPPVVASNNVLSVLAFDPDKASAVGRTIALEAVIAW